jgi:hypothetical protein
VFLRQMTNSVRNHSRLFILCLARAVSGSAIYYAGVKSYDSGVPASLLVTAVPAAFLLLTVGWHGLDPAGSRAIWPPLCLLAGPILLLPVYFALLPPQVPSAEGISFLSKLAGGYTIIPLLVFEIQLLPMGWALDFSALFSVVASMWIRRRMQDSDGSSR